MLHLVDLGEVRLHVAEELLEVRRGTEAVLVAVEGVPFDADDEMFGLLDAAGDLEGEAVLVLLEQAARARVGGFEGVRLVSLDDTWSAMMFRRA